MAKKQKPTVAPADDALKNVSDYRFPEATRENNPPAKIAAEGYVPLIPKSSDAVQFYARNDHMGLTIPYEYMGIDHAYEPDFLVRLSNGLTVVEIKGFEDDQTKAKHAAASRWVEAVNNWGQLRRWAFHVSRNPQLLGKGLEYLARAERGRIGLDGTSREEL